MGLDMYLKAERYLSEFNSEDRELIENIGTLLGGLANVKTIGVEVGYWRKANQIHKWFVDNVQDGKDECQKEYVSRDQLQELRDLCVKVIANSDQAEKSLPSASGFFFGDTSYDEGYFRDLEDTIKIIDAALIMPDYWDFYYQSSW